MLSSSDFVPVARILRSGHQRRCALVSMHILRSISIVILITNVQVSLATVQVAGARAGEAAAANEQALICIASSPSSSRNHARNTATARLSHAFRFFRNVGDDWSCAPENHLPENNVKLFRRIPEGASRRLAFPHARLAIIHVCNPPRSNFSAFARHIHNALTAAQCAVCLRGARCLSPVSPPLTPAFSRIQFGRIDRAIPADCQCVCIAAMVHLIFHRARLCIM